MCGLRPMIPNLGAVRRNAVPGAAPVPVERLNELGATVVRHILRFVEDDGFSHPRKRLIVEPPDQPLQVGCVTVTLRGAGALVAFQYDTSCGVPERWMRGSSLRTGRPWQRAGRAGGLTTAVPRSLRA